MRKGLFLMGMAAVLLCLCGCKGLSERNARMEDLALLRVLAVDGGEDGVSVSATTGPLQQQPAVYLEGAGGTVGSACQQARESAAAYAAYSHVEQILVGEDLARQGLTELLDYLERDVELRLSSRLWLVRGEACAALTKERAEEMVERLSVLEETAGVGANGPDRTAGDVIAARERSGCTFLPVLTLTEAGELICDGYGVLKEDRLICWLEGDQAVGVSLLLGAMKDSLVDLTLEDGRQASVRVGGAECGLRGELEDGTLTSLGVRCKIRASAAQLPREWRWSAGEREQLERQTARWAEDCIRQSIAMMQSIGADPLELGRRVGQSQPWRWETVLRQWETAFPHLDIDAKVAAAVEE